MGAAVGAWIDKFGTRAVSETHPRAQIDAERFAQARPGRLGLAAAREVFPSIHAPPKNLTSSFVGTVLREAFSSKVFR